MYHFGERSESNLMTCHEDIQLVMRAVIEVFDFSIICGHRIAQEQNDAEARGASFLTWPYSRHNTIPSLAVDAVPYPVDWEDINKFFELAGHVRMVAHLFDIPLEWGGEWAKIKDYPHWQLPRDYGEAV